MTNYTCLCLYSKVECIYLITQVNSKMRNEDNYLQGIAK